ncbi:FecR family protein [Mucilaginibacter jinjuensis]|uniref:FecR family protein n=1 Tax=Mucilaginibacter jinjuensis TaxID=1176721 RepID=A0ABY7T7X3_9SPHI|nr:FecR family protein [Mucilaginibacter jinjuensis]WCT12590.1 FecR family protein [Mucilaginibacter jinjuensis]
MKVTDNDMPDELLAKYLKGKATPDEKLIAEEWINTNDANRQYYEQLKITIEPDNHEEAWIRLQNLISKNHGGHINKPENKFKARWVQLVVTIILIGSISYFIRTRLYSNVTLNLSSGADVVHDDLPDGTLITLNTNSQLSYPARFTGNKRSVTLSGEGYFEIKPDKSRPFIINIKNMFVSAGSASVDIKSSDKQTEIAVVSGAVKVISHGKEVLINKGEQAIVNAGNSILTKESYTGKKTPAWAIIQ